MEHVAGATAEPDQHMGSAEAGLEEHVGGAEHVDGSAAGGGTAGLEEQWPAPQQSLTSTWRH